LVPSSIRRYRTAIARRPGVIKATVDASISVLSAAKP
jgi:hypothetical protein